MDGSVGNEFKLNENEIQKIDLESSDLMSTWLWLLLLLFLVLLLLLSSRPIVDSCYGCYNCSQFKKILKISQRTLKSGSF